MANRQTKIESLGLGNDVQSLLAEGMSARRIASRLRAIHPELDISDSSVIRYVSTVKQEASREAFAKIKDHVDRVVPDDLKALEEMESQCLAWAREAGKDRIDRMAEAAAQIANRLEEWRDMLLEERDDEARRILVKKIIRECLEFMAREDRLQSQRDRAMNTAIKIIDLKLRQAGLLDDDGKGRIVLVNHQAGRVSVQSADGEYEPFTIPVEDQGEVYHA